MALRLGRNKNNINMCNRSSLIMKNFWNGTKGTAISRFPITWRPWRRVPNRELALESCRHLCKNFNICVTYQVTYGYLHKFAYSLLIIGTLRSDDGKLQPRPQGLLAFQYGGGRREDPGTQQKSRDWFVHGEWKFIQNGGQVKEWEDLGTRSWDLVKNKQNGGRGKLNYKPEEYGRMI